LNGVAGMLRSTPYSTTAIGRYTARGRTAQMGTRTRVRPQLTRNHDHQPIANANSTSGTNRLYCIAKIGWPVNS